MEDVFLHRLRSAYGSPVRLAWVWCRAVGDVLLLAVLERTRRARPVARGAGRDLIWQDLRWGARALGRAPLFSAAAVTTLALGIGATVATFSVAHAVLFRALPYEDPDRLVMVWPEANVNKALTVLAQAELPSLEQVSGISRWDLTLTGVGEPQEIVGTQVSVGHFELLGIQPMLGRSFRSGEDLPGAAAWAMLSHDFWMRQFGGDPAVIGRRLDLAGAGYDRRSVIGVMPPGFRPAVEDTDIWIPLEGDPALTPEEDQSWYVNYRVARLASGATLARANEEIRGHAQRVHQRLPRIFDEADAAAATVQPLRRSLAGSVGPVLLVALGAVFFVLLIACANVINLLLARGEGRAHDLSVRAALGAGRVRVARMLFAESALLGLAGGGLGVAVAYGLVGVLVRVAPADFPRIAEVGVGGAVLAFSLVTTLGATVLAGLVPALRVSRVDCNSALTSSVRGTGRHAASRLGTTLVGVQVALAVVVAVGAGLMLRSLNALLAVDPGIDGARVLTFRPTPPQNRYQDGAAFQAYYRDVTARVAALPGITSVGAINLLPGTNSNWSFPTFPEGVDLPPGSATPSVNFRAIRPGYFPTVGVPLQRGRLLTETDRAEAEPVVVVNRAFVERFWPGEDAVGRNLRLFRSDATAYRVVGVVADVRQHRRSMEPLAEMYFSHDQVPWNQISLWVMARVGSGAPLDHAEAVRAAVWEVDPDVPIAGVADLGTVLGRSTRTTRFLALLLTGFGVLALALGGIGIFGVTTHTVGRRIPEFGVRIALGASRGAVLAAALRQSALPVALGMVAGLAAAAFTSDLLASALYEISSTDPLTFLFVAVVLGLIAVVSVTLPAWRASGVDPVAVLDAE